MPTYTGPCGHYEDGRECGAKPTRLYLPGRRCERHTPAALAGRSEPTPGPGWQPRWALPSTATQLYDDRAVARGRRRSSQRTYEQAVARENERRAHEQTIRKGRA